MQFCSNDGSLADCGAHPLDRPGPHVAGGEHATSTGFQWQRPPGSIVRRTSVGWDVRSRQNTVLAVQPRPALVEPGRCRLRTDEEKDVADRLFRFLAGHIVAPAHALELLFPAAVQGNNLRVGQYFDIFDRPDAVDEILRHAFRETWPAHQHPDFGSEVAQKDGSLPRRVAAPDQNDLLVPAQARLDR